MAAYTSYNIPRNNDALALFEYSVKMVLLYGLMGESKTHAAWAYQIFKYEKNATMRSELMSIVKREYSAYFDEQLQYCFLEDKIRANFPYLFGIEDDSNLFEHIQKALDAELIEQRSPKNRKSYRVSSCIQIPSPSQIIYKAILVVEEGDDPRFAEGMPFDFRSDGITTPCEVVEFDYVNAILFFSSPRTIYVDNSSRVISDATYNIIALKKHIEEIASSEIDENLPLYKFLNHTTEDIKIIEHGKYPSYIDENIHLDESQLKAFNETLSNDISFIWGPPGTGKSFTLAAIIMALYHMEAERTAVCCLSNVAVDQLVRKVVDIIEEEEPKMQRGEFYRAGRTQDERLIATDFLFPDDDTSRKLRFFIGMYGNQIEQYKRENKQYSDEAIKVKAKIKDYREDLKKHTDYLISQVKVVFSTISNFVINPRLKDGRFENLIVDEASMLAMPQLIALARKVTKRIILVGDFQQLSPITTAGVPLLRNSVFKLCGIDITNTDHPALHQLLNQRRSNPKLVDIINHAFYADKLNAKNNKNNPIVARAPYNGCVMGLKDITDGEVRFTKGGTRQNKANAIAVIDLLDLYYKEKEDTFSIGVITPYSGQVSLLKALFIEKAYSVDFQDRVNIGTVHTFQGSECDVIIFDMVDCSKFEKGSKTYFGKIYHGEQGEQLLNVAVSRAKHKIIFVCDADYLKKCPGGTISDKSKNIFKDILKASRWE